MRALILFVAVLFASISTFGQHFTGCVVDTVAAKRLPEKASNTRDVYSNLPKAVSLQKWTPDGRQSLETKDKPAHVPHGRRHTA